MGDYTLWYGENKEEAEYLLEYTNLAGLNPDVRKVEANQTASFVRNPDAIKDILYLDKPDIILTSGFPERPVLGAEFSKEAMTGHDIFQRFARIAAAAKFSIPFAYVFPRQKWVKRKGAGGWDYYNPSIFTALKKVSRFHGVPALGFFWEVDDPNVNGSAFSEDGSYGSMPASTDPEMQSLFEYINRIIAVAESGRPLRDLTFDRYVMDREAEVDSEYHDRLATKEVWSPLTSTEIKSTKEFRSDFKKAQSAELPLSQMPDYVRDRDEWVVYSPGTKDFRADPYGGALLAVDYLRCRTGPTSRERDRNLVVHFQKASISDLENRYETYYEKRCAFRPGGAPDKQLLTLHLREGCRYNKQKELRIFFSACDLVMFKDGFLF